MGVGIIEEFTEVWAGMPELLIVELLLPMLLLLPLMFGWLIVCVVIGD